MVESPGQVLVVLNDAGEASIPLEVAAGVDTDDLSVDVCSFFKPDTDTFGVDVTWLGVSSQLDPRGYARLVRLVRRIDPNVVHIHPNATGSVARCLLALTDTAVVTTEHNSHDHFGRLKRVVNGLTNVLNDVVVANSETTRRSFAKWERVLLSKTGTDVKVIHNGVDVDSVVAGGEAGTLPPLPDGFRIGTAGRLVPQKNQAALIRAAAPVVTEHDDVHLLLVGSGELETELKALAADHGISENTHLLGYLPRRRDVYEFMGALDVFAFPSRYEGFGVAVAEAMVAGVPVVANNIPILHEVVGDAGVFVDANDTAAFSDAIADLYDDEEWRRDLAAAGAERIEREFSLAWTVDEHTALYRELTDTATTNA